MPLSPHSTRARANSTAPSLRRDASLKRKSVHDDAGGDRDPSTAATCAIVLKKYYKNNNAGAVPNSLCVANEDAVYDAEHTTKLNKRDAEPGYLHALIALDHDTEHQLREIRARIIAENEVKRQKLNSHFQARAKPQAHIEDDSD